LGVCARQHFAVSGHEKVNILYHIQILLPLITEGVASEDFLQVLDKGCLLFDRGVNLYILNGNFASAL